MEYSNVYSTWYELERQELLRAYEAIQGSTQGRIIPHGRPLPKLSDVLRCAQLAKTEPVIWEWAQKEAFQTDEEFEEYGSSLFNILMPYTNWYRLKNGLYDHDDCAFVRIDPTLRALARSEFDRDEVTALRYFLESYPGKIFVDDLKDDASQQGDAV